MAGSSVAWEQKDWEEKQLCCRVGRAPTWSPHQVWETVSLFHDGFSNFKCDSSSFPFLSVAHQPLHPSDQYWTQTKPSLSVTGKLLSPLHPAKGAVSALPGPLQERPSLRQRVTAGKVTCCPHTLCGVPPGHWQPPGAGVWDLGAREHCYLVPQIRGRGCWAGLNRGGICWSPRL